MTAVALTIAGSDPSGGAGIQADLKTFHRLGVYGEAVITLITVQNTRRVTRVQALDPELVAEQIRAVVEDIPPVAAKTGALGNAAIVRAVAAAELGCPLVVDPVMISTHGAPLMDDDARRALVECLLPRAFLITPNLPEAAALAGFAVDDIESMRRAAEKLAALGARAVLVKGGHLPDSATDILYAGGAWHEFHAPRITTRHTHGTGCTYSAAITAELAKGAPLADAVARAKRFVTEAIRTAPGLGGGAGPVNHQAETWTPRGEGEELTVVSWCTHRSATMRSTRVGIREFRENLSNYLGSATPVAITRHGATIGFYVPAPRKRSEADLDALRAAGEQLDALIAAAGTSEDELVEDFKRMRNQHRKTKG